MYSLGPAGRGAIAGALLSSLNSLVAPACGALPELAKGTFDVRPEPEIICVSSPAGFGEIGLGGANGTEPLNNCVNPPGDASVRGGVSGGGVDGWAEIAGVLNSSVKPLGPELEKGVGEGAGFG